MSHPFCLIRYEKKYMEEAMLKAEEQAKENKLMRTAAEEGQKSQLIGKVIESKVSTSSSNQQDLDSFLLGDLEDSDGGPGTVFGSPK